ncbi:MAG TPA: sterol carrier family protein [Mycobacteriales bacterium]|nr:sterol carrier family protein [Mycobacteriales bacterium]
MAKPRQWPYDALRLAVPVQYTRIADAVDALDDADLDLPTRLGEWRVAALVAHLEGNLRLLLAGLSQPSPQPTAPRGLAYRGDRAPEDQARIADLAQRRAAGRPPAELRAGLRSALDATVEALSRESEDRVVLIEERGPIRLSEYLVTRCTEGVVHGLDLAAATGTAVDPEPTALRTVVRLLADRLVERAPGQAVEVRIPGPAGCAVQCVEGPRHTRGTPGSVVEVRDPHAWVELASGRRSWSDSVGSGLVLASGEHADLSPYLPVLT